MKASVKFREDRKPIFKAKLPHSILGFPFQSGFEAGDTANELSLTLSSSLYSGPIFKLSYRPNDSFSPLSFRVKTGIGHLGSPIDAPITMTADFNLLRNGSPYFFLHFNPHVGDFSLRRSVQSHASLPLTRQSSVLVPNIYSHADSERTNGENSVDGDRTGVDKPVINSYFPVRKAIDYVFSGMEVSAKTTLPVRDRALVKFRWSVKFPAELRDGFFGEETRNNRTAETAFGKMPCLVLSKVGIEHVAVKKGPDPHRSNDVGEACSAGKKELDVLKAESALLRKCIDELRSEIYIGKSSPVTGSHNGGKTLAVKKGE